MGAVALVTRHLATRLPTGDRIVAVFPDGPHRYTDTLYSDAFCQEHGLLVTPPAASPDEIAHPGERTVTRWTRCATVVDPLPARGTGGTARDTGGTASAPGADAGTRGPVEVPR